MPVFPHQSSLESVGKVLNERNTVVCDFYLREKYSIGFVEEEFATKDEIARRSGHGGHFTEARRSIFIEEIQRRGEEIETLESSQQRWKT